MGKRIVVAASLFVLSAGAFLRADRTPEQAPTGTTRPTPERKTPGADAGTERKADSKGGKVGARAQDR